MASGKLLVLIGDECKRQEAYHGLDKTYEFEVLLGASSDSGDVLGLVTEAESGAAKVGEAHLRRAAASLTGPVTLPYPKFSSKTVNGKPLHTWTLEGRINEITIPTYKSHIYALKLIETHTLTREEVYIKASKKIESIPPVTDTRKAIGNDFRRPDVRATWNTFRTNGAATNIFIIARFSCTCASGTYMRTLAEVIAREVGTTGLAFSIHRTHIGIYQKIFGRLGYYRKRY